MISNRKSVLSTASLMPNRLATIIVVLIALGAIVALALPGTASANGCPLRSTQGTAGTTADPIRIDTVAELNIVAANSTCYASAYVFKQTTDLTLTAVFTPIGSNATPFNGTYDGGGHTISGLTVNNTTAGSYKGMFGVISGATVKNLTLRGASIVGTVYYYGVVAGQAKSGSLIEQVAIIDSSVASSGYGSEYMGGVVGSLIASTVRDVKVSGLSVAIAVSNDYIGGITGQASNGAVIERVSADVSFTGAGSYVGGIAGISQMTGTTITDAYARGSVSGSYSVGGLLGAFYGGGGPITRSYATVRVTATGSGTAGGLVGRVLSTPIPASAVASFWDIATSGQATSANGAVGKTTSELTALSTFVDAGWTIASTWSAARTWTICAPANDGYPFLSGAYTAANEPCSDHSTPDSAAAAPVSATEAPAPAGTLETRNARVTGNTIRTQVTVSGAGSVRQTGGVLPKQPPRKLEASIEAEERALRPAGRTTLMVACRASAKPKVAGTVGLACSLSARTLNLVEKRGVIVVLKTTFQPTGGAAATSTTMVALPKRAARPSGSPAPENVTG